jgi:NitT/TauT family transport system permease protein
VARIVYPICGFTRYLPVAALVPLCILWFGIDDPQKIAVIVIGVMFQLTLLFAAHTVPVIPRAIISPRFVVP